MTQSQGDWGQTELDPAEEAAAQVNLDEPSAGDDEPWSPPDRQPRGAELIGVESEGESLDQRLRQEEPEEEPEDDVDSVGGDDPDAIPADSDVLGGPAADVTFAGHSPEEAAMRVEETED